MRYDFEWDLKKSFGNRRKHKIGFERAATIFRDPSILTIPDTDHSKLEERWITIGMDENGTVLTVVHTFTDLGATIYRIRMISARKATKAERKQYEKGI